MHRKASTKDKKEAYKAGSNARSEGLSKKSNPYCCDDRVLQAEWYAGWHDQDMALEWIEI